MRSYKVFAIKDGGSEEYVQTVYSSAEGKLAHQALKSKNYFDEIVVRDALGGKVIHRSLKDGSNLL